MVARPWWRARGSKVEAGMIRGSLCLRRALGPRAAHSLRYSHCLASQAAMRATLSGPMMSAVERGVKPGAGGGLVG